jgi:hypothetical protein
MSEISVEFNILKTNINSFTHKTGKITQLIATATPTDVTVTITSVHKGTAMTVTSPSNSY